MAKIQKKIQVIADNLQKVDVKVGGSAGGGYHGSSSITKGGGGAGRDGIVYSTSKTKTLPAAVEVHSVEPLSKDAVGIPKSKGKIKSKKKKGEVLDKKEPVKCPIEEKEEGFTGYAGLARRVAGRIVGEIRGKPKFWFDD